MISMKREAEIEEGLRETRQGLECETQHEKKLKSGLKSPIANHTGGFEKREIGRFNLSVARKNRFELLRSRLTHLNAV